MSTKPKNVSRETITRASFTVDWVTFTSNRNASRDALSRFAYEYLEHSLGQGNRSKLWSSFGYDGWDIGGMRWGRREQDDLCQLRGEVAETYWRTYLPLASGVSRLDLAATVQFKEHPITIVSDAYNQVLDTALDLPIVRNYAKITSLKGGDTLYVGKRSSTQFGRLYDKGLQSKEKSFANCIRWEVELKKEVAWSVSQHLARASNHATWISAYVYNWFKERMIECPWRPTIAYNAIEFPRRPTTTQMSLGWLQEQVQPTVTRLCDQGLLTDVLNALGLSHRIDREK